MKNKKGFTLAEMMVVLLIMTIIAAATLPLVTRRHKKTEEISHGRYECYYNASGKLVEKYTQTGGNMAIANSGVEVQPLSGKCTFVPPRASKKFNMYLIGGGGGGGGVVGNAGHTAWSSVDLGTSTHKLPYYIDQSGWRNNGGAYDLVDSGGIFRNALVPYLKTQLDPTYIDWEESSGWITLLDSYVAHAAVADAIMTIGASGGGGGGSNYNYGGGNGSVGGNCMFALPYPTVGSDYKILLASLNSASTIAGGAGGHPGTEVVTTQKESPYRFANIKNNLKFKGKMTGAALGLGDYLDIESKATSAELFNLLDYTKIATDSGTHASSNGGPGSWGTGNWFSLLGVTYNASPGYGGTGALTTGSGHVDASSPSGTYHCSPRDLWVGHDSSNSKGHGGSGAYANQMGYPYGDWGGTGGSIDSHSFTHSISFTSATKTYTPARGTAGQKGTVVEISDLDIPTALEITQVGKGGTGGYSTGDPRDAESATAGGTTQITDFGAAAGGASGLNDQQNGAALWYAYTPLSSVLSNPSHYLYNSLCYTDASRATKTINAYCSYGTDGVLPSYPPNYPADALNPVIPKAGFCYEANGSGSCHGGTENNKATIVSFGASGAGGSMGMCSPRMHLSVGSPHDTFYKTVLMGGFPGISEYTTSSCGYYNQENQYSSDYAMGGDGTSGAVVITW